MQRTCTNELTSLLFHILPLPRSSNNYARMILYNYLNIVCTSSRWRLFYDLLFMILSTHVYFLFTCVAVHCGLALGMYVLRYLGIYRYLYNHVVVFEIRLNHNLLSRDSIIVLLKNQYVLCLWIQYIFFSFLVFILLPDLLCSCVLYRLNSL